MQYTFSVHHTGWGYVGAAWSAKGAVGTYVSIRQAGGGGGWLEDGSGRPCSR